MASCLAAAACAASASFCIAVILPFCEATVWVARSRLRRSSAFCSANGETASAACVTALRIGAPVGDTHT